MESRRWRPRFFNPFTERKVQRSFIPLYRGFFRVMPLHRWPIVHIHHVLGYAAANPSLFGFPEQSTCIVNTAFFLPSLRGRQNGLCVFGHERGCKSIIIPSSCNREPFDEHDAKLVEPLFHWNPGIEYVYLSLHCQPMAAALIPYLARCRRIHHITLEGWSDAVAIHRVVMACKHVDVLDTFGLDDPPRQWRSEIAVQALCTLVEMHPRLRSVQSHRLYLADWHDATQYSRCKHNVALVNFTCDFVLLFNGLFYLLLIVPASIVYVVIDYTCRRAHVPEAYTWFWSVVGFAATIISLIALDTCMWASRGRGWVHMQRYAILAKRRLDILVNVHQTSLVAQ